MRSSRLARSHAPEASLTLAAELTALTDLTDPAALTDLAALTGPRHPVSAGATTGGQPELLLLLRDATQIVDAITAIAATTHALVGAASAPSPISRSA